MLKVILGVSLPIYAIYKYENKLHNTQWVNREHKKTLPEIINTNAGILSKQKEYKETAVYVFLYYEYLNIFASRLLDSFGWIAKKIDKQTEATTSPVVDVTNNISSPTTN